MTTIKPMLQASNPKSTKQAKNHKTILTGWTVFFVVIRVDKKNIIIEVEIFGKINDVRYNSIKCWGLVRLDISSNQVIKTINCCILQMSQ